MNAVVYKDKKGALCDMSCSYRSLDKLSELVGKDGGEVLERLDKKQSAKYFQEKDKEAEAALV